MSDRFDAAAREIAPGQCGYSDCFASEHGPCGLHRAIADALRIERDAALEDAALIADQHWPESGHVHPDEAVSCQMSISILIRRLKRPQP